jgi:hypothetical protein
MHKEVRVRFSKRMAQIEALRAKHGHNRSLCRSFPDLSCKAGAPSLGTGFAPITRRASGGSHPDAQVFPTGNLHKQGPVLITPGDIASGQLKFYGGGKPNHSNLKD